LETFHKIMIFVDEADAMFGDISSDQETERRLTGKIQAVMSDPALRGRVIWFLMTARVHRLSPDIRRPGRMDLIIPILDPEGEDMDAFIKWAFGELNDSAMADFRDIMKGSSSARYSMMRSQVKSKGCKTPEEIKDVLHDLIEPDIGETRQYQTLQAKVNCTRRSLLVDRSMKPQDFDKLRSDWHHQIVELEKKGIK
jgi:SpoVK/Ycf46/Vps4 family AAA+-type ATPase